MVPSTGFLKWFDLQNAEEGFTLRFPRRHKPTEILPLKEYPKLLATFRQYGDWLELLGIDNVGSLNDSIKDGRIREIILVSEALHDRRIGEIAAQIASRLSDKIRSGKLEKAEKETINNYYLDGDKNIETIKHLL